MAGEQERQERHDRHEPPKFSIDDLERLFAFFQKLSNRSDLTKDEARRLIANAQPTLDNLKAIQGS